MPERPRSRYLSPVTIGREAEIAALRAFLGQEGGVLLLAGEAGIGKSRLLAEARAIADSLGMETVIGRSFEADRALPYAPAIDLLQSLIEAHGAPAIADLAGVAASDLALLAPELGVAEAPMANHELTRRRLRDAFARLLAGMSARRPLLVAIEDIHWPDASSLDLLLHLGRRTVRSRLYLLLTYRDDEVHPELAHLLATLDRERLATEIRLERLTAHQVAEMLQAIFAVRDAAPAGLLHDLFARSDGNPFYVEELLTSLATRADLVGEDGQWTSPTARDTAIPRSVHDAVRQRVANLSEPARQVLLLAAVAGRRFDFDLLGTVTGASERDVLNRIKELVAAQLVVEEREDRFTFRHALTREAILAGLLERERRQLHRRITEALLALPESQAEQRLDALSEHGFAAGMWAEALAAARQAGERALALHAPGAAAEHLTRAIAAAQRLGLPPDGALHLMRGRACATSGAFDQARADFDMVLDLARNERNLPATWEALAELSLLWAAQDYRRMGDYADQALRVAREIGDPRRIARSLNRLGNWRLNREEPHQAVALHREALAMIEPSGDQALLAETLDLLGIASLLSGDLPEGHGAYTRAVAAWRDLGNPHGLAASLIGLSISAHNFHTATVAPAAPVAAVWEAGEESLRLSREIGWRAGEVWALWAFRGMTGGAAGFYDVAIPATREAIAIAREIEHVQWQAAARCVLANIHADLGDFPTARREMETALRLARQTESPYWTRSSAAWLASVLTQAGQMEEATALLAETLDREVSRHTIAGRRLWFAQAETALASGQAEEAIAEIDRLIDAIPGTRERPIALLELVRGQALAALGRLDEATAALSPACASAQWSGARPLLWRIHAAQGRTFQQMGNPEAAAEAFTAAAHLAQALAASVAEETLRIQFQACVLRHIPSRFLRRGERGEQETALTRRELEIAALLREGLSNREIGERLFLSEWTAATHVRNILTKLNLSSRAQIAAWAAARDLHQAR